MPPHADDPAALAPLLALVRERDGLDLSGWRRGTLARRVQHRVAAAGDATLAAYVERLRADPAETARLIERITVKVSRFHRNREAVDAVARALAGELARSPRPLRAWSAGCGRGEEPYTLAMLLAELAQPADPPAVLASDVDAAALAGARAATYGEEALEEVAPESRRRWFQAEGPAHDPRWRVREEIRRRVTFARDDVGGGGPPPPGAPFDLVACRNTLIYFEAPLQRRALARLLDALAPGGLLWLGEAEWPPGELEARLRPVDRRARLFRLAGGEERA